MISREEYYVSKPKIDAACKRLHHAYVAVFGKRGVSSDERVAELNAAIDYFEGLTSLRPGDVLPTWFDYYRAIGYRVQGFYHAQHTKDMPTIASVRRTLLKRGGIRNDQDEYRVFHIEPDVNHIARYEDGFFSLTNDDGEHFHRWDNVKLVRVARHGSDPKPSFELCSEQDSEPETETKTSPTELQKVRWSSLVERLDRQDAMLNEILRRIGS